MPLTLAHYPSSSPVETCLPVVEMSSTHVTKKSAETKVAEMWANTLASFTSPSREGRNAPVILSGDVFVPPPFDH